MRVWSGIRSRFLTGDLLLRVGFSLALFAFVLGARWAVVDRFGSDLPEWDQWDAEGLHSLVPWFERTGFLAELVRAQNEHRVVVTKLVNLGLTLANGQWDQKLECTVNAMFPAMIALGFYFLAARVFPARRQVFLVLLLMAAFGLPLSWQNIVSGFHSQQFFLLGFSAAAIALLPNSRPGSTGWVLGALSAALALWSMASGLLAAAVVTGLVALRIARGRAAWRAQLPTLGLCAVLVGIGLLSQVTFAPHEVLKAHTARDFALTVVRALQWPASSMEVFAILYWLPWCRLAWRVCRRPGISGAPREAGFEGLGLTLLGLGAWVLLQLLATAYARGAGGPSPASRYIDTLAFGQVVNGLSLAWLWRAGDAGLRPRLGLALLSLAWSVAFAWGAGMQTAQSLSTDLPQTRGHFARAEQNVHDYLATGDEGFLFRPDIPYPGGSSLLVRIRIPVLRNLLPGSVRPPIFLKGAPGSTGFAEGSFPPPTPTPVHLGSWGSSPAGNSDHFRSWESEPIVAHGRGYLRFEVAGHAGEAGVLLELEDAVTHARLADLRPAKVPGFAWRSVFVPEPSVPFIVAARDGGSNEWLAFTDPVEIGPLSYRAWRVARSGAWIAGLALLATVALAAFAVSPRKQALAASRVTP
jgi:hypothetical protein